VQLQKKGNKQLPASKFIAAWYAPFPRDSTAFLSAITLEVMKINKINNTLKRTIN